LPGKRRSGSFMQDADGTAAERGATDSSGHSVGGRQQAVCTLRKAPWPRIRHDPLPEGRAHPGSPAPERPPQKRARKSPQKGSPPQSWWVPSRGSTTNKRRKLGRRLSPSSLSTPSPDKAGPAAHEVSSLPARPGRDQAAIGLLPAVACPKSRDV